MSENTNNEANVANVATDDRPINRFQTADYTVDSAVADQIKTLKSQLWELCEKNGVPMLCVTGIGSKDGDTNYNLSQSYSDLTRVPKLFGAASHMLLHPYLLKDEVAVEVFDAIDSIAQREFEKLDPIAALLAQLAR